MNEKLRDLNKLMKSTVLKEVHFSEKNKKNVLRKIQSNDAPKNDFFIVPRLVSVTFTLVFLFGLTYFFFYEINESSGLRTPHNSNTPLKEKVQEENYEELSKEEVVELMLNSVDNIHSAKGLFNIHNYLNGHQNTTSIEYQFSLNRGFYIKESTTNPSTQKELINYRIFTDGKLWDKDEEGKISEQIYDIPSIHEERLTIDKAFLKDNQGFAVTNYRQRPEVGRVSQSLYPYEIAANHLRDFNLWDIEEQNYSILQHNTVVLSGKLQEETSKKQNADAFKFWVDKDTGILIKYESYNKSGHIVDYLTTEELYVNVPINASDIKDKLSEMKNP